MTYNEKIKRLNPLRQLPLAELIAEPNCGLACPPGREFSCGCDQCAAQSGYWRQGEKEARGLAGRPEFEMLWDQEKGFLTDSGCSLGREMRSEQCLRAVCADCRIEVTHE